ncbi:tetratricopeptide repeat protein [Paenibacillus jiagnxiensis]|uniref:hypothetical protein n=1 Tax=Paenibacillus jiagnxiensis TaxID=3228926 RepID=UPI0038D49271
MAQTKQAAPPASMKEEEINRELASFAKSPAKLREFVGQFDWPNQAQRQLAEELALELYAEYKPSSEEMQETLAGTIVLWNSFCKDINPGFRKPGGYKGALEFFFLIDSTDELANQSKLAAKHNVSVSTLTNCLNRMKDYFEEKGLILNELENDPIQQSPAFSTMEHEAKIGEITRLLEAQNFESIEDAQAFLSAQLNNPTAQQAFSPATSTDKVLELLVAADKASSPAKRKKLLDQAIHMDPEHPDTLLMLSEDAPTMGESMKLAHSAIESAAKKLGEAFFEENRGYFWGLIETRPFMRAKAAYAHLLALSGRLSAACEHYEQLMELNPNDNQGNRYDLLMHYLELERLDDADRLLKSYGDEVACFILYDKLILEYLRNGVTEHLTFLYRLARKENKHVPAYLLSQKRLPADMPYAYSMGSTEEAVTYAISHARIWDRLYGLKDWMAKTK